MAILRESVDLVIDGADFYRSIEYAPITKLRNGWCDFALLASQQAREITSHFAVGTILYFDPRANGPIEESYGSNRRRALWSGRLKHLNVSELLVSKRLDYQNRKGDPDSFRKATQEVMATLARREFSENVLVLSSKKSPLLPYLEHLQDSQGFSKGMILPPGESESGGLTHDELEQVQLCGGENDDQWAEYWRLKQDSHLIANLWKARYAEIHQAVGKRMRRFGRKNYPKWLKLLEENPARDQEFLSLAKTDLAPFIDAIKKDNRRLASEPDCARFCVQQAVREVATVERLQWRPPAEQARVHRWEVSFHEGCQRDTEKWPRDARDELHDKCELLRERGPQLTYPLVRPVAGSPFTRLRLYAAGGAYRIVFARGDRGNYLLLAGGKKGGSNDDRFYQDMKARATSRIREYSKHPE